MTTDTLQFSYEKQTVYFFGPTKVINDSITIFCKKGWYHVNKNEATLYNKAEIIQKAIEGQISEIIPTTYLQLHKNTTLILDKESSSELTRIKAPWLVSSCKWSQDLTSNS